MANQSLKDQLMTVMTRDSSCQEWQHSESNSLEVNVICSCSLLQSFVFVALLARRCIQRSALGTEHSSRHFRLSVHRCELWPHTWMDRDAVWGGESGRARKRCIRFWW